MLPFCDMSFFQISGLNFLLCLASISFNKIHLHENIKKVFFYMFFFSVLIINLCNMGFKVHEFSEKVGNKVCLRLFS